MRDEVTPDRANEKPDFDSLLADLFGLNIRGARTLWDLIARPKRVFESARVFDWRSRYTPTMRLAFSILTVFSLLSFFWTSEDGVLYQTLLLELSEKLADEPNAPPVDEMLGATFAAYNFLYPFSYMLVHTLAASILFVWGKGTPWVARIRLYFGVASVGIALATLSVFDMPFLSVDQLVMSTVIGFLLSLLAFGVTYARGMSGEFSPAGLYTRAVVVAVFIMAIDFAVAFLAGYGAGQWASFQLGL
ncbi:MAG: hypothetical protein HRT80_00925 [Henriciella sp.]|nr:hypothetical protein [Henriciella sp.]